MGAFVCRVWFLFLVKTISWALFVHDPHPGLETGNGWERWRCYRSFCWGFWEQEALTSPPLDIYDAFVSAYLFPLLYGNGREHLNNNIQVHLSLFRDSETVGMSHQSWVKWRIERPCIQFQVHTYNLSFNLWVSNLTVVWNIIFCWTNLYQSILGQMSNLKLVLWLKSQLFI